MAAAALRRRRNRLTGNEKRKGDETASLASVTAAREEEEKKKLSRKLSDYRADHMYLNCLLERGKCSRGNLAETFGHPTNDGPS